MRWMAPQKNLYILRMLAGQRMINKTYDLIELNDELKDLLMNELKIDGNLL